MKNQKMKNFRISARDYAFTYPRCTVTKEDMLQFLQMRCDTGCYFLVSSEPHADGSPHLHAQVQFTRTFNLTSQRKFDYGLFHPNIQKTKSSEDWNSYVKKKGTYIESGEFHDIEKPKTRDPKEKNKELYKKVMENDLVDLLESGEISMFNFKQLSNAKDQVFLQKNKIGANIKRECYWIYGGPGIGKSFSVRDKFPELYNKPQNKWWDGYKGESTVLIDDFDCKVLDHYMKTWGDNYSFNAEIKGGTIIPGYTRMFVTSNYFPDDEKLWKEDSVLCEAITRRFRLCTVTGEYPNYSIVDWITGEILF